MNKDNDMGRLDVRSRIQLFIGETQIQRIVKNSQVEYLDMRDVRCARALEGLLKSLACVRCERIPLELMECTKCKGIVCKSCAAQVNKTTIKCPDQECQCENFEIQNFSSKIMLKQLKEQDIEHCCKVRASDIVEFADELKLEKYVAIKRQKKGLEDEKADKEPEEFERYKVNDLFEHLRFHCRKNQKECPLDKKTFDTPKECHRYIREVCELVEIQCDTCDKWFSRKKFKNHICYHRSNNFRTVIQKKDKVIKNIRKENTDLEEEIGVMNEQMDREGNLNEGRINELNSRINLFNQHIWQQDQMIEESQNEMIKQTQRFAKASHKAPTHISRRYNVNAMTCFDCSFQYLSEDLIDDSTKENKINNDYYFHRTKRMNEYSALHGYDGTNVFCSECSRECTYIQVSGIFYECGGKFDGNAGCGKMICDQCQQMKVLEFDSKPYLALERIAHQQNLNQLIAKILEHQGKLQMTPAFDRKILEEYPDDDDDDQIREKGAKMIDFQTIQSQLFQFYQNMGKGQNGATPGGEMMTPGGPTPGGPTPGGPIMQDGQTPMDGTTPGMLAGYKFGGVTLGR